jgi:DNA-binding LacI/PurR family transcriptional regulator
MGHLALEVKATRDTLGVHLTQQIMGFRMLRQYAEMIQRLKPLPKRQAAEVLEKATVEFMVAQKLPLGTSLTTDREMARVSGLSHATVRRVLRSLRDQGWLDRKLGHGSFVGPRVQFGALPAPDRPNGEQRLLRIAVLLPSDPTPSGDAWIANELIEAMNQISAQHWISVEILHEMQADTEAFARRLAIGQPDALVVVRPNLRQALLAGEARRMGISVLGYGMEAGMLGVPSICTDEVEVGALAARTLADAGHRRIGFVQVEKPTDWVFARRKGFRSTVLEHKFDCEENLTLWISPRDREAPNKLAEFIQAQRPTALFLGAGWLTYPLGVLVQAGRTLVPAEISVLHADQTPQTREWFPELETSCVLSPLQSVAEALANLAKDMAEGRSIPMETTLQPTLRTGQTIKARTKMGDKIRETLGRPRKRIVFGEEPEGNQ